MIELGQRDFQFDSSQISAIKTVENGSETDQVSIERIREAVTENTPGISTDGEIDLTAKTRQELLKALFDWNRRGERFLNGLNPSIRDDREVYLDEFENFIYGGFSDERNYVDSRSSEFDKQLQSLQGEVDDPFDFDIGGITVEEAVERASHFHADRYHYRDSVPSSRILVKRNGKASLLDNVGLAYNDTRHLETIRLSQRPTDKLEASLKLLIMNEKSDVDWENFKIDYPVLKGEDGFRWGREETISLEEAKRILDVEDESDIEDILSDSANFLFNIWDDAAREIENEYDLYYPERVDSFSFFEMLAYNNLTDVEWNRELWDSIDLRFEESDPEVSRDSDNEGRRIYMWDGEKAYSVTTIPKHGEIDFGNTLENWKKRNDGSGETYDSEIISEYAAPRGTLAHDRIFSNYVEDPESIRDGEIQQFVEQIKSIEKEGLKHILKWKNKEGLSEEQQLELYEKESNESGFIENGWELAEKELDWIEDEFKQLEDQLGLSKENVIEVEKKFGIETEHPTLPEIGSFKYGGQIDMIYQHEETGETVLLDLKTSKDKYGVYEKYKLQSAAYAHAAEQLPYIDVDSIDRIVIPVINPETMMFEDGKSPTIYTNQPLDSEVYDSEELLRCGGIESVEGNEYPREKWGRESWRREAMNLFARAADSMPEIQGEQLEYVS